MATRPIANQYREGRLKSTLKRELKVRETGGMETDGAEVYCLYLASWVLDSSFSHLVHLQCGALRAVIARFDVGVQADCVCRLCFPLLGLWWLQLIRVPILLLAFVSGGWCPHAFAFNLHSSAFSRLVPNSA